LEPVEPVEPDKSSILPKKKVNRFYFFFFSQLSAFIWLHLAPLAPTFYPSISSINFNFNTTFFQIFKWNLGFGTVCISVY